MKKINVVLIMITIFWGCQKTPIDRQYTPPHIISFQTKTVKGEYISIYYIDSITNKKIFVQLRTPAIGSAPNYGYADSIPTGNFLSQYLWDACNNGVKDFMLKFSKQNVVEMHNLFVNFKHLPSPGGFEINDAKIDGKPLPNLPPSDSSKSGHYDTGFIYNR